MGNFNQGQKRGGPEAGLSESARKMTRRVRELQTVVPRSSASGPSMDVIESWVLSRRAVA